MFGIKSGQVISLYLGSSEKYILKRGLISACLSRSMLYQSEIFFIEQRVLQLFENSAKNCNFWKDPWHQKCMLHSCPILIGCYQAVEYSSASYIHCRVERFIVSLATLMQPWCSARMHAHVCQALGTQRTPVVHWGHADVPPPCELCAALWCAPIALGGGVGVWSSCV